MASKSSEPTTLEERSGFFTGGFRMSCECGGVSSLSSAEYQQRSTAGSMMQCEHCDGAIHFDPTVAASPGSG